MRTRLVCIIVFVIGVFGIGLFGVRAMRISKSATRPEPSATDAERREPMIPTVSTVEPIREPKAPAMAIPKLPVQPVAAPADVAEKATAPTRHAATANPSPQEMATSGIARVEEMNANYINAKSTSRHEESKQEGLQ